MHLVENAVRGYLEAISVLRGTTGQDEIGHCDSDPVLPYRGGCRTCSGEPVFTALRRAKYHSALSKSCIGLPL